MAILSSADTGRMVINTNNGNVVVINMPPTPPDAGIDANADDGIQTNNASTDTASMVINTNNSNVGVIQMTPMPPNAGIDPNADDGNDANAGTGSEADAVSKLMQLALGGIGVGNFSAGSAGAAYQDQLLAGSHGRTYKVAFFVILGIVYLASVGQMMAAARLVSLDSNSTKKITFVSFLLLLVLVVFGLVSYYILNNH